MSKMGQCIIYIFIAMLFLSGSRGKPAHAYMLLADTRIDLEERGLTWEAVYTGEFWANTKGGLKRDETYLGNFDFTMTIDTEQAGLWKNGTFFVYFLDNHEYQTKHLVALLKKDAHTKSRTILMYEELRYYLLFEYLLLFHPLISCLHDYPKNRQKTSHFSTNLPV